MSKFWYYLTYFCIFGLAGSVFLDLDHIIPLIDDPNIGVQSVLTGGRALHVPMLIFLGFLTLIFLERMVRLNAEGVEKNEVQEGG